MKLRAGYLQCTSTLPHSCIQYSPKIMHPQELLFASADCRLLEFESMKPQELLCGCMIKVQELLCCRMFEEPQELLCGSLREERDRIRVIESAK